MCRFMSKSLNLLSKKRFDNEEGGAYIINIIE